MRLKFVASFQLHRFVREMVSGIFYLRLTEITRIHLLSGHYKLALKQALPRRPLKAMGEPLPF